MARNSDSSEPLYLKVLAVALLVFVAIETPDGVGPTLSAITVVDSDKGHIEDVYRDSDLVRHFKTQDTGIACSHAEASLFGETFDRTPITGSDDIVTVGCN
jgi:hypothetical protein